MTLMRYYSLLTQLNQPVFETNDVAACLKMNSAHASKVLSRLAVQELVFQVKRGLWCMRGFKDSALLAEYLTAPLPTYLSLYSALFHHGMISQVPSRIYAVTLNRTQVHQTPIGTFSFHHMNPSFFGGYDIKNSIKIAKPEKAVLDLFYLCSGKTHFSTSLPEIELPKYFSLKNANRMIQTISSHKRRAYVRKHFDRFMKTLSSL